MSLVPFVFWPDDSYLVICPQDMAAEKLKAEFKPSSESCYVRQNVGLLLDRFVRYIMPNLAVVCVVLGSIRAFFKLALDTTPIAIPSIHQGLSRRDCPRECLLCLSD